MSVKPGLSPPTIPTSAKATKAAPNPSAKPPENKLTVGCSPGPRKAETKQTTSEPSEPELSERAFVSTALMDLPPPQTLEDDDDAWNQNSDPDLWTEGRARSKGAPGESKASSEKPLIQKGDRFTLKLERGDEFGGLKYLGTCGGQEDASPRGAFMFAVIAELGLSQDIAPKTRALANALRDIGEVVFITAQNEICVDRMFENAHFVKEGAASIGESNDSVADRTPSPEVIESSLRRRATGKTR